MKASIHKKTCLWMFIAPLFTTVPKQETNQISNKELYSHKDLSKFNNKKSSSSVKNGMIRHFSEEDRPWQLSTWEDVQYHYSPGNEN